MSSEDNGNNATEKTWTRRGLLEEAEKKLDSEIKFLVEKDNLNTRETQNLALLVIARKLGVEEDQI